MTLRDCDDTVLVIRMWREPGVPFDGSHWRGRVDLLPDGERRFFVGVNSLLGILDERLRDATVDRPPANGATSPAPTRAASSSTEAHDGR